MARPVVGCGGCTTRGREHGADESPFLGQAGGGCGAGGAFLAGRAAGTNVFPTWPRIPGSARSHGQDAPAATPAPAASFPQRGEGGRECGGGGGTGPSRGAVGACGVASQGACALGASSTMNYKPGRFSENKSRARRRSEGRKKTSTAMGPWPCLSLLFWPRSSAPTLFQALEEGAGLEGSLSALAAGQPQIQSHLPLPSLPAPRVLLGWGASEGCGASGGRRGRGFLKEATPSPSFLEDSPSSDEGTVSHCSPTQLLSQGQAPGGKLRLRRRPTQSSLSAGGSWQLSLPAGLRGANES